MRKSILASILILCLILSMCGSVFAAPITPDVAYDAQTGILNVSGTAEKGAVVTLMVLKKDVAFDDTTKVVNPGDVLYFESAETANGAFAFEVAFQGASGTYQANIADSKSGERYAFSVAMVNPTNYPTAVSALNAAAAGDFTTVFKPAFEANKADMGFESSLSMSNAGLKMFQANIAGNNLSATDHKKNMELYQTFCAIEALNGGTLSDITPYLDDLYFANATVKTDFASIASVSGASVKATEKMSGQTIVSLDDFYKKFTSGMILGATQYTAGVNKLMSLLSAYGTSIGITKAITYDAVSSINGREYATIEALVSAYNAYTPPTTPGGISGGGGGGGGFTGSAGGTTSMGDNSLGVGSMGLPQSQTQPGTDKTVNASYHDIEGYKWATTAILALTDLGIVNGKGDGIFAPEDNVLREEFAKILVGALGEAESGKNGFSDVIADAWYCGWVNRAAELGLCQGVGGGAFGVGTDITREDMCLMIVNALKKKGYTGTAKELTFKDADAISDYAKEAVGILYGMGAVNGISETEFAPKSPANRAQAAKIIYYVLEYLQ